jgi:protocatechuate 3,4-dioxygenase beta subunit
MTALVLLLTVSQALGGLVAAGTAEVRGRITDRDSGMPVPHAVVRLMGDSGMQVALSDDEGRYEFRALRPGRYGVYIENPAFRADYVPRSYLDAAGRAQIVLNAGEARDDVHVQLARAAALTVRVVDEFGEPLANVRLVVNDAATGRNAFLPLDRTTDDRGVVRVFPLAAGRYVVCGEPHWGFMLGEGKPEPVQRLVRTCAADEGGAVGSLPVSASADTVVDLVLRRSATFSVSGVVVDASGQPTTRASLSLERSIEGGSWGFGLTTDSSSRFALGGLPPGDYAIRAELGGPDRPEYRGPAEAGYLAFRVDRANVDDLTIALARTVSVKGRVTFEDGSLPVRDARMAPLTISARLPGDRPRGSGSSRHGYAYPDWTFDLEGLFGRRILEVTNVPPGWCVKSVVYGTADVTDSPVEFKSAEAALEVRLSTRGASIAGRVSDENANAVAGARVYALPADIERRASRFVQPVRASPDGRFRLGPLRAGDYLVVAIPRNAEPPMLDDEATLARLQETAERVTLRGEESIELDLRLRQK